MAESLRILRLSGSPPTLRRGTRLDQYRLQKQLGEGGFASVYSAYDQSTRRHVALKIPHTHGSSGQTAEDIQREVDLMADLEHPGVLRLIEAREIRGHFVIAFPLGEESLAERLGRRMGRATAIKLIYQMVSAVAFAHENQILHRDIKPENLILFPENRVCLTDFGLARVESGDHYDSASGTLGYIAAEQAMGKPTFRSDVFSLGLVIYRMLSGALPEYPFLPPLPEYNKLRRGISRDLVALIRKAIDPDPKKRFRDAVAMNNALLRIRSPLTERPNVTSGTAGKATTRRRVA
ncbi:MAG: serine/threonine-protein kinase [Planctomycetota bacterium]